MVTRISHIGIAVRSIASAAPFYCLGLGLEQGRIEELPDQRTRVALLPVGDCRLELLEAMSDESPVARFVAKRGEGMHHICLEVGDIREELRRLRAAGAQLIDEEPRIGAEGCLVAFVHPSSASGVLVELSQPVRDPGNS